MIVMALWLGIYPNTFLSDIDPAVQKTVARLPAKRAVAVGEGERPKIVGAPPSAAGAGAGQPGSPPPMPPPLPRAPHAGAATDELRRHAVRLASRR